MKILLYPMAALLMLTNLGATDVFYANTSEPIEKSKYELSVRKIDIQQKDRTMPGVTLSIHNVASGGTSIELTYARSISKYDGQNVFTQDMPLENAFYAQFSYRF